MSMIGLPEILLLVFVLLIIGLPLALMIVLIRWLLRKGSNERSAVL